MTKKKLNHMIKSFKDSLERQDRKKYTIKEIKKIIGKPILNDWKDEARWN